jgi:hypothetical protein
MQRISIDVFYTLKEDKALVRSPQLDARAAAIYNSCKCFIDIPPHKSHNPRTGGTDNKWRGGGCRDNRHVVKGHHGHIVHDRFKERVKIGIDASSTSNKDLLVKINKKREFFSLINKLSIHNKAQIYKNIDAQHNGVDTLNEYGAQYIQIIWDMMLRMGDLQKLYVELLLMFKKSDEGIIKREIHDVWKAYIDAKLHLPPTIIDAYDEHTEYDEFCDFVKWKKRSSLAVHAFHQFILHDMIDDTVLKSMAQEIVASLEELLKDATKNAHVINAMLDQIHAMLVCVIGTTQLRTQPQSYVPMYKMLYQFITNTCKSADTLPPIVKFKVLDIYEYVQKNDTSAVKHNI